MVEEEIPGIYVLSLMIGKNVMEVSRCSETTSRSYPHAAGLTGLTGLVPVGNWSSAVLYLTWFWFLWFPVNGSEPLSVLLCPPAGHGEQLLPGRERSGVDGVQPAGSGPPAAGRI